MSTLVLLIGSFFLFLGIKLSLNAQELQRLGFPEEGRDVLRQAIVFAMIGFLLWAGDIPSPQASQPVAAEACLDG